MFLTGPRYGVGLENHPLVYLHTGWKLGVRARGENIDRWGDGERW